MVENLQSICINIYTLYMYMWKTSTDLEMSVGQHPWMRSGNLHLDCMSYMKVDLRWFFLSLPRQILPIKHTIMACTFSATNSLLMNPSKCQLFGPVIRSPSARPHSTLTSLVPLFATRTFVNLFWAEDGYQLVNFYHLILSCLEGTSWGSVPIFVSCLTWPSALHLLLRCLNCLPWAMQSLVYIMEDLASAPYPSHATAPPITYYNHLHTAIYSRSAKKKLWQQFSPPFTT